MTPQERAAKTLLSDAIKQVYEARWKSKKDGEFSHNRASLQQKSSPLVHLTGSKWTWLISTSN